MNYAQALTRHNNTSQSILHPLNKFEKINVTPENETESYINNFNDSSKINLLDDIQLIIDDFIENSNSMDVDPLFKYKTNECDFRSLLITLCDEMIKPQYTTLVLSDDSDEEFDDEYFDNFIGDL